MNEVGEKKLPEGWRHMRLGDVGRLFVGGSAPQGDRYFSPDGPSFYRVSDIGVYKRTNDLRDSQDHLSEIALEKLKLVPVEPGTIVFPKSGASVNTNNRAIITKKGYLVSHLMGIEVNPEITDKNWVYWALCQIDMTEYSDNDQYPSLKQSVVEEIKIPLPPLPDQQRIARILKTKLAVVERARQASEARLEAARELPAAYLREVFESEAAREWSTCPLGELGEIASGITLGRKLKPEQETMSVPYLRVANVKDGRLDLDEITHIAATSDELEKWQLTSGDLLLTEGGDPDKLGRGTVWQEEIPGCIHQNHIFRVRLNRSVVNPFFASFQMQSRYGKSYFLKHAKQTTGIATINQQVLKAFPMRLPEPHIQETILEHLCTKLGGASKLVALAGEEVTSINSFPASLLRQAFSGAL